MGELITTTALLDLVDEPEGFDAVVEVMHKVANAKKDGTPKKRERFTRDQVRTWLLGQANLRDEDRIVLDTIRRSQRLQARFKAMMREIVPDPYVLWRAPDGGRR